ncbi:MAG: sigma-70 family RNA polymerase sigma factor [Acidobacteriia bacterium]|nr:sigma-70 family RNA polymerase sigma factor [Terriglobia bacterium]
MPELDGDVTLLLTQVRDGNQEAANQLVPLVYNELRRMAGAYMRGERPGHTLQATALVNEAYMRLAGGQPIEWQNRAHFFAIAAHTMREVLLDYARRFRAGKRGGSEARRVEMDEQLYIVPDKLDDVIAIDEALERLAQIDPRQSRIVELRFFAGLNVDEAAEVMGVSPKTIKREWRSAKAWLHREMAGGESK